MVYVVMYRAVNAWYWYVLPLETPFDPLLTPDGHHARLRKALVDAREYAKEQGLSISYIHMER